MKKIYIIVITMCLLSINALAQHKKNTDANIYGHIISKKTGEHLPYAQISLRGTAISISADATGHYFMKNLPEGKFFVDAALLGYKKTSREVDIKKNQTIEISFQLDEDAVNLDQVVVSSSRTEVSRRLSPSLVNIINSKLMEQSNSVCLADGLSFQPGVRVEDNCQNCGFTQVRINGLDGHYSQILIDSRPVFSALNEIYGLEQIPTSMIDRIEVVRGGGSALFGSSAIGGTVNIITKEPTRNSAEFLHTTMRFKNSGSFDNTTSFNASLVSDDANAGIYVYGQNRYRSTYDRDGDGYSEFPKIDGQNIGMRSFIKTGTYSKINFEYHSIKEFRRGGDSLIYPPHTVNLAEQTKHNINGGGVSFDLFSNDYKNKLNLYSSFQNTKRESYYGSEHDDKAYGHTKDFIFAGGAQFIHKWDKLLFMPGEFTGGSEYSYNNTNDKTIGYKLFTKQTVRNIAIYAQNEWRSDKWSFLLGARLDKHNLIDNAILSPRANIRFNPSKNINFRLSYSTGFRAPQTFDEDLHTATVGGERLVIHLAKNLKQEKSQSISFSADIYKNMGNIQTNFLIEGFYTNLRDVFALRKLKDTDTDGNTVMERYNGSGAKVFGINAEGKVKFSSHFDVQAGITLQKSKYKEALKWSEIPEVPAEKKMFRSPDIYGYITANILPTNKFGISVSGTYTGKMLVQHMEGSGVNKDVAVNTPTFSDLNVKATYDINLSGTTKLQLFAGIKNLFDSYQKDFDKGPERDSRYIYGPSVPRSAFVGIKFNL